MIQDGFGDLSEVETMLVEEERFFHQKSAKVTHTYHDHQDAMQEARIAAWEVFEKEGDRRGLINFKVNQQVWKHVLEDRWTGYARGQSLYRDPIRTKDRYSLDDPDIDVVLGASESLDEVAMAYHHGEIVEAINSLPDNLREFVVLKFWGNMKPREIAKELNITAAAASRMWTRAKPKLAEALEHLART